MLKVSVRAALLSLSLMAQSADATVINATFAGEAMAVQDGLGLFSGTATSGAASMSFLYDTELGTPLIFPEMTGGLHGGPYLGTTSPVTSASISLNGVTATASSAYSMVAMLEHNPGSTVPNGIRIGGDTTYADPEPPVGTLFLKQFNATFWANSISAPTSVAVPFSVPDIKSLWGQPGTGWSAQLIFSRCTFAMVICQDTSVSISVESFRSEIVAAPVPLPASAALLLTTLGMGGVGGLVCRSRQKRAA